MMAHWEPKPVGRMNERRRLKPVDCITYLALVVLTVTTLITRPPNPHGGTLLVKYGSLAFFLTVFWWLDRGQRRIGRPLHALYPVVFIPIIFDSLANLLPWASPILLDDRLIQLDRVLLGVDPTVWIEPMIHPVLTELLTWAYASYYFLPVVLLLSLYLKGKQPEYDRAIFGIVLCFYLSYVGYFLVPAVGPRFTLIHLQTVDLHGIFAADTIRDTLNYLERFKQDAFPSAHTAVVLMVLFYAWQFSRGLFWAFLPVVGALILSTVYLRYHYVIDVVVGILLTGPCIVLERMVTAYWQRD